MYWLFLFLWNYHEIKVDVGVILSSFQYFSYDSARDNKEISANIHKYKESVALLTR